MKTIGHYASGSRALVAPFLLYLREQPEVRSVQTLTVKSLSGRAVMVRVAVSFRPQHPTALQSAKVLERAARDLRLANAERSVIEQVDRLYEEALDLVGPVSTEAQQGAVLRALQACADRNVTPVSLTLDGEFAKLADYVLTPKAL